MSPLLLLGCFVTDAEIQDWMSPDTGSGTSFEGMRDTDDGAVDAGGFSVSETSGGLVITITDTQSSSYWFGAAETSAEMGWAGEDCLEAVPEGYGLADGGVQVCHPLGATGGSLARVKDYQAVVAGESTLFWDGLGTESTYIFLDADETNCWVFGHDVSYYAGSGCTEL